MMRPGIALAASVVVLSAGLMGGGGVATGSPPQVLDDFVGAEACGECHAAEYERWRSSTHGKAGGEPSSETVVAPFDGTPIRFRDAQVIPRREGSGRYLFVVRRAGREAVELEVTGVIGRGLLLGGGTQGFVSSFADGTHRFLPFDYSVSAERWFCNTGHIAGWWVAGGGHAHLRPDTGWVPIDEDMKLTDCGDWPPIRVLGNDWRYANCQQCHGSQIGLTFVPDEQRYRTSWTSLAVNCESCHGPGRAHVQWARLGQGAPEEPRAPDTDLGIAFPEDRNLDGSLEVCFQCHALKRHLRGQHLPGRPLLDAYSLGLPFLGDRPYNADGKVRTFAYQANHLYSACYYSGRMSCVDCHDPHGQGYRDVARLPLSGPFDDGQCLGCHASKAVDPARHTFHPDDSEGARCVSCHMPYRQHPGVGEHVPYGRSDHSISIPRPGVDEDLGARSACALCHADVAPEELARQVEAWYGRLAPQPALVEAVATARRAVEGRLAEGLSPEDLVDPTEPNPLLRMAALNELFTAYVRPDLGSDSSDIAPADQALVDRLRSSAASGDPDVAATSLALLLLGWGDVPEVRAFLDRRRAQEEGRDSRVLIRWGRALQLMGDAWRSGGRGEWALRAFARAQEVRPADPGILLDLASAYTGLGRFEESLPYYVEALRLDPTLSVAHVNLGLTLENLGREEEAEGVYLRAVQVAPFEAVAHMNLGNMSLRRGDALGAAAAYGEALRHDPSMARAGFYLAVALVSLDDMEGAREALLQAREFAPDDPEIAQLLARVSAFIG